MNTHVRRTNRVLTVGAIALSVGIVACSSDSSTADAPTETTPPAAIPQNEPTTDANQATEQPQATEPTEPTELGDNEPGQVSLGDSLSEEEITGLLWMREEEQLAHDVYLTLHEQWGLRIFENITASESSHIEATLAVMDSYGITDPAAGNEIGTFAEPELQQLYDRLVSDGSASLVDALEVGAFIEELDINDLRIYAANTGVTTLTDLYAKLEKGSRNHLRAFTSQLDGRDSPYEPTVLDRDAFDEIVSSPMERGHDA